MVMLDDMPGVDSPCEDLGPLDGCPGGAGLEDNSRWNEGIAALNACAEGAG